MGEEIDVHMGPITFGFLAYITCSSLCSPPGENLRIPRASLMCPCHHSYKTSKVTFSSTSSLGKENSIENKALQAFIGPPFFFYEVMGIEPRAPCTVGKHSTKVIIPISFVLIFS